MYHVRKYKCGIGFWYYLTEPALSKDAFEIKETILIESCNYKDIENLAKILNKKDEDIKQKDEEIQRLKSRLNRHYG